MPRTRVAGRHGDAQGLTLDIVGTQFRVTRDDGSVLTSRDLVGAVLNLSDGRKLRIDAVEADPEDREGEVLLHTFSVHGPDGRWSNPCEPDPDGRRQGFPLAGRALPNGHLAPEPGAFEIVCTSGAQGKCVRFGYKPWKPAAGGSLRDHHHACIHMVRADYCGDGTATTRDGTAIDIFDPLGIQRSDGPAGMSFEAGWTATGAVCLAHVRIPENTSLDRLRQSCPRLASVLLARHARRRLRLVREHSS